MGLAKQFTLLATFALISGLIIGLVPFYGEFSVLKSYPMEVDVVYAYFKTFSVSENITGLRNEDFVAYVIVLNITNPTSETIRIKYLGIHLAETASKFGQGVQMTNTVVNYERDFSEGFMDYYWFPNFSRLVAFGATSEVSNLGMAVLEEGKGYFYVYLDGRTQGNAYAGGSVIKKVTLEIINDDEFVYNTVFKKNERFHFRNDELGIGLEWW
jgi:hypothetical protein